MNHCCCSGGHHCCYHCFNRIDSPTNCSCSPDCNNYYYYNYYSNYSKANESNDDSNVRRSDSGTANDNLDDKLRVGRQMLLNVDGDVRCCKKPSDIDSTYYSSYNYYYCTNNNGGNGNLSGLYSEFRTKKLSYPLATEWLV